MARTAVTRDTHGWPLKILAALLLGFFIFVGATSAHAADDSARAVALKKLGDDSMDSLRYIEALAAYSEAYTLSRDPVLLYNMGRAHEVLGNYPEALEELEQFQAQAMPDLRAKVPHLAERLSVLRSHVAVLTVRSNVAGARVLLRDKTVGVTPLEKPLKTSSGRGVVEVTAEGFTPFRVEIDLRGGQANVVNAQLLSRAATGVLVVQSQVVGAEVLIDGKAMGRAPVEATLSAGTHPLLVRKDGYEPTSTSAVVGAGERRTVTIPLEVKSPLVGKWWFWAGVGVVVAAGVLTTVALVSERKADTGTYPPGQVSGPLLRY